MRLVEQRDPEIPVYAACEALNVSRASLYRSWQPAALPASPVPRVCTPSPRRLDDAERQEILDTFHLPEFVDQPPTEVYATLLGRGTYLGSVRTMYRVLAEAGETRCYPAALMREDAAGLVMAIKGPAGAGHPG